MYDDYRLTSAYYNIFRLPNEDPTKFGSSLYRVYYKGSGILILIALTPGFLNDAYKAIKNTKFRKIYLITPSSDIIFISDVYNVYNQCKDLGRSFTYITKNAIKNKVPSSPQYPDDFVSKVIVTDHYQFTLYNDNESELNVTIDFDTYKIPEWFDCYDIILYDGRNKKIFSQYMDEEKGRAFLESEDFTYDQIHMPFNTPIYGGLTYLQLMQNVPGIRPYIYTYGFTSYDQYDYCRTKGINIGGVSSDII